MLLFISPQITNENQTTKYGISTDPAERMDLASSSKTHLLQEKLDDTNKKVSSHSVRMTSVGQPLEVDFQPNFVTQLSGHENFKSLDSYHSASLKRQREMSAILSREPDMSAHSEET